MSEDKSSLSVAIEGKIILIETKEDGTKIESELPDKACETIINHLIHTLVISAKDLVPEEERPLKFETED